MTSILKHKRFLVIIAAFTLIAAIGGTYAWFTDTTATTQSNMKMGDLSISSSVVNLLGDPDYLYEPGDYVNLEFTLDNASENPDGFLPAFVQANFDAGTVTRYYDAEGYQLATPVTEDIDPLVLDKITTNVKTVANEDEFAAWYLDRITGTYYVLLNAGTSTTAGRNFKLSDLWLGNAYRGADFNLVSFFPCTQVNKDAILEVFDLDLSNLDPIDEEGNIIGSEGRNTSHSYYMNLLYDMMK
jgi:SipW-cognate class signal peptide